MTLRLLLLLCVLLPLAASQFFDDFDLSERLADLLNRGGRDRGRDRDRDGDRGRGGGRGRDFDLQRELGFTPSRFPRLGRCRCSDFMWRRDNGVIVGQCKSMDTDGLPICYLHRPNGCRDAIDSQAFCGMQISKIGCGCRLDRPGGFCVSPGPFTDIFRQGQSGHDGSDGSNSFSDRKDSNLDPEEGDGSDGGSSEAERDGFEVIPGDLTKPLPFPDDVLGIGEFEGEEEEEEEETGMTSMPATTTPEEEEEEEVMMF